MHGSPFDDRTMALAIAVQMLKYCRLPEYRVTEKPGPGTMGFLEKRLYPEQRDDKRTRIGQFQLQR